MAETAPSGQRRGAGKIVLLLVVVIVLSGAFAAWVLTSDGSEGKGTAHASTVCANEAPSVVPVKTLKDAPYPMTIDREGSYSARFETSCGIMTVQLDPGSAPLAVNNFVHLADARWYDGVYFYRIAADGTVSSGDPREDGSGGPGYTIGPEPADAEPALPAEVGSIVMVEPNGSGSGGSQFSIITTPEGAEAAADALVFGQLADDASLEIARRIATVPASADGVPSEKVWVQKLKVTPSD